MIASLLALSLIQVQQTAPTVVEGVVIAAGLDYRLRVEPVGADTASTMVLSQDPPMFCSDARFQSTPGPARQCWLRGRRGDPIVLTAQHDGVYGRDWAIDWTGCQPQGDGRSCAVDIAGEMRVGATFRSL